MNDTLPKELSLAELITNYSEKFNNIIGADQHHVSSPLGAWMLLAFLSEKLEDKAVIKTLGVDTTTAATLLESMMSSIPAPVAATIHGWINPDSVERFEDLFARTRFDECLEVKFPEKKELDDWLTSASKGILTEFPLEVDETFMGLFASVLATDVKWRKPLEIEPAPEGNDWGVKTILSDTTDWNLSFVKDEEHGLFAVHSNRSEDDLVVYSVIPVSDVSASNTLKVANKVAAGNVELLKSATIDTAILENASKESSIVSYVGEEFTTYPGVKASLSGWLPAWESENEFDLSSPDLRFKEAAEVSEEEVFDAIQVTKAEYTAKGFKAAAVTAVMIGRSAAIPKTRKIPAYKVNFNKPYAVAAVVDIIGSPWNKVPVFTGYIKEAVEAE